jgi:rubrerythrin
MFWEAEAEAEAEAEGEDGGMSEAEIAGLLQEARLAEKRQSLFYRSLASAAEAVGDAALSERFNELHADEQHHLSRLTVRLMELQQPLPDLGEEPAPDVHLEGWEELARGRETEEIARYAHLLNHPLDDKTRHMIVQFLEAERGHEELLGGKWMGAEPW